MKGKILLLDISDLKPKMTIPVQPCEFCLIEKDFFMFLSKALERDEQAVIEIVNTIAMKETVSFTFTAERRPVQIERKLNK